MRKTTLPLRTITTIGLLLGISWTYTACSLGPDFVKPKLDVPKSFTRQNTGTNSSNQELAQKIRNDWWTEYGSVELNGLVELALKNNFDIEAASANLKVAQANVRAQQGYFFPTVGLGYNALRQNTGTAIQPAVYGPDQNNSIYTLKTSGISVGFVPDIWGGNRRQVEALKALGNASSYQLEALRITVANNVLAAAIQEASLREQLVAVKQLAASAKAQLDHARRLRDSGYASSVDLALQESLYAQAIAQTPVIEKSREQTLNLLNVLCGQMPSEKLLLPNLEQIKLPAKLPSSLPADLLSQRPDIQIAEEYVRSANAQIGVALANMLPQFNVLASAGNATAVVADIADQVSKIWSISGGVSQSLFAGGTLFSRKQAADAATDAAVAQYKSAILFAYQNVADTLYALQSDKSYLNAAIQNENASKVIFDQASKQFKVGYISEPAKLQTEQTYLQAKINRLQASATYLGDTTSLYQALGGGWSLEKSKIY
ncbi:efflux transporter outer membrane subunit [Polynucleobacter kasalickyi]|uniref:Efflux transporter, outer membrane factor (OMF) lipoprotein, NodT family n=1 Tax=Polynucleobacter kasalickyi TaxID=1938817 RepID=A0A1W2A3Q1_9BURK|nr:efflux transporter outer membrane subunit [Polynucleobacter kasalickyi]SMC55203.1 efflux transporter, outer membrane factor (OMF) lipoprotein, NodT family [Polynucleobacter kasalickyi]